MKKKKINKEKLTKIFVYVFCFALVGLSLFSLFSVFVGATVYDCDCSNYNTNGVCEDCGNCAHWYCTDGACDYCSFICPHPEWSRDDDGYKECVVCHFVCDRHRFGAESICDICGDTCFHRLRNETYVNVDNLIYHFTRIECLECGEYWDGTKSLHNYVGSVCSDCGFECKHSFHNGNHCSFCDYYCSHPSYTNSVCDVCNITCTHYKGYNGQYCVDCGARCSHPSFEFDMCETCGFNCDHSETVNGVCVICKNGCRHDLHTRWEELPLVSGYHNYIIYCADCSYVERTEKEFHNFDEILDSCVFCGFDCPHLNYNSDDGNCTICRYRCPHPSFDDDSFCTNCGFRCGHNYTSSVIWKNDTSKHEYRVFCSDCGHIGKSLLVNHTFKNYDGVVKCSSCWYVCKHDDTEIQYIVKDGDTLNHTRAEVCTYCGTIWDESIQGHEWLANGTCKKCSYACTHPDYTLDGYCTVCGWMCTHPNGYELIYVPVAYNSVSHPYYDYMHWTRSVCVDCGQRMRYADAQDGAQTKCTYENGVCTVCNNVCSHRRGYYNDGVKNDTCIRCKSVCDHSVGFDSNSKCNQCNYVCAHPIGETNYSVTRYGADDSAHVLQYTCGLCNLLYKTSMQDHRYKDTSHCNDCGYDCKHSVYDGINCKYCSYTCPHEKYVDGICDECGLLCSHKWHNSTCKICNMVCADHTYTNGSLRCDLCDSYVVIEGYHQNDGFFRLMTAIYDSQANTFLALTDYNILGVNIAQLIFSIVCLVIAVIVFKIAKKVT